MPVVHLAAVDALKRQALADDKVHVHLDRAVAEDEKADLAAVAHHANHLAQRSAGAEHLKADIKALDESLLAHGSCQVLLRGVDGRVRAYLLREPQSVVVQVGDDHAPRAGILGDGDGKDANGTYARDEHVLTREVEHQRRVRRVADRVEHGDHILVERGVDEDDIARGDAEVLRERAVAVYADARGVLAPLDVARVTVAAVAAGDVPLARNALADGQPRHARAERGDLADILVPDDHGRLDVLGRPLVPVVDVHVRAADGGFVDLDKNFAGTGDRDFHLFELQTGAGTGFADSVHKLHRHVLHI